MENIKFYELKLNKTIKDIKENGDDLMITFEDDTFLNLESSHDQDCCENVYADFSVIKYYKKQIIKDDWCGTKDIVSLDIKFVEDMGMLLVFRGKYSDVKVFIACYNEQNGYYSSELTLTINNNGNKEVVDISRCVEDYIG